MKARKALSRSPVVMRGVLGRRRRARSSQEEMLGAEALEVPMPGSLLVLLSRLARSDRTKRPDDETAGWSDT